MSDTFCKRLNTRVTRKHYDKQAEVMQRKGFLFSHKATHPKRRELRCKIICLSAATRTG